MDARSRPSVPLRVKRLAARRARSPVMVAPFRARFGGPRAPQRAGPPREEAHGQEDERRGAPTPTRRAARGSLARPKLKEYLHRHRPSGVEANGATALGDESSPTGCGENARKPLVRLPAKERVGLVFFEPSGQHLGRYAGLK